MWYFRLAKLLPSINQARRSRLADVRAYFVASIRVRACVIPPSIRQGQKLDADTRVNVERRFYTLTVFSLPNTTSFEVFAHSFVVWPVNLV
jgi:hypothetical protein